MNVGSHFSIIDNEYLDFLRNNYDNKVPQNDYEDNEKFFFGMLTKINEFTYYIPVSSFKIQQRTNKLIINNNGETISSLRFCFMLPVPENTHVISSLDLSQKESHYINIVDIEDHFCQNNREEIERMAKWIYDKVSRNIYIYSSNSCYFKKLEQGCKDWTLEKLSIKLKEEYKNQEIIYILKNSDFDGLVDISNGTYSRVENFNKDNSQLQKIKIYAKDEFEQEKYIEVIIKVEDGIHSKDKKNKELAILK